MTFIDAQYNEIEESAFSDSLMEEKYDSRDNQ